MKKLNFKLLIIVSLFANLSLIQVTQPIYEPGENMINSRSASTQKTPIGSSQAASVGTFLPEPGLAEIPSTDLIAMLSTKADLITNLNSLTGPNYSINSFPTTGSISIGTIAGQATPIYLISEASGNNNINLSKATLLKRLQGINFKYYALHCQNTPPANGISVGLSAIREPSLSKTSEVVASKICTVYIVPSFLS